MEDDPLVAELNQLYLQQVTGFRLAGVVRNGDEALRFMRNRSVQLILLDLFRPKLDGMDFLKQVRSSGRSIDVIMVTAARNGNDIAKALRHGVVDYVVKPFTAERLQTALITYRERIRLLAQNDLLDQQEIDQRILTKTVAEQTELPKGLERETLRQVEEQLRQLADFTTTQQLSGKIGISRVSLRKYLAYLAEMGRVETKLTYRAIGRPVNMYRYKE